MTETPLDYALALVDFGPCKTADRPQDWISVAAPLCKLCAGAEDVVQAAARIITAEYRNGLHEITRLENENDRITQENLDMARELGMKAEPDEPFCR